MSNMIGNKEIPRRDTLRDYNYAVAGHAGTLCDAEGELFIKPCTQSEIDFYQSANRRHHEFSDLMPLFMGTLSLSDPNSVLMDEGYAEIIHDAIEVEETKEHISEVISADIAKKAAIAKREAQQAAENVKWVPNKSKKISTDKAVVLGNASHGFKHPNILDAKLGVRLWADDAPLEKKQRFDKISKETTHANLGFRIAGMRVFRGSENSAELDEEDYRIYDKDYGRVQVNDGNIVDAFRKFVFNKHAGIDEALGRAICTLFLHDLRQVEDIMTRHESRMFSASLLFIFEGDGESLSYAIEKNNEAAEPVQVKPDRTNKRVDSGIEMDNDSDSEVEFSSLPQVYALKLIDFAHAEWTPGQGPDENTLTGVRSLIRIFEEMEQ